MKENLGHWVPANFADEEEALGTFGGWRLTYSEPQEDHLPLSESSRMLVVYLFGGVIDVARNMLTPQEIRDIP